MTKKGISTLGLIFITFLSAIQYIFIATIPDSVSTFQFLFITNLVGAVILAVAGFKHLKRINRKTFFKGFILAAELIGFNVFVIMGARGMESIIISSVLSMYFIFIPIILIILKQKFNFFSTVASAIAIIALLLMFNTDINLIFSSVNVFFFLIADIFFAAYVVSISFFGKDEDSMCLTLGQMFFSVVLAFIGWIIEVIVGSSTLSLPTRLTFWLSVIFIGVFIRGVYGIIQISCQKYVPAINASLIFSSEIIITLVLNETLCNLFHVEYEGTDVFQVIGCFLLIIATLLLDEKILEKLGYADISDIDCTGRGDSKTTVSRKLVILTVTLSLCIIVVSTVMCIVSIYVIRNKALTNSAELGDNAAQISRDALMDELEDELQIKVNDKAELAESKLLHYYNAVNYACSYAETLLDNPTEYPDKDISYPLKENGGIWAMQRTLKDESITYDSIKDKVLLLGNMEDVFTPIVRNNSDISNIYLGIDDGLFVSYDTSSDLNKYDHEVYWDFTKSNWYRKCKHVDDVFFTETYNDSFGRGLTVSCIGPIHDSEGNFIGCLGIDIMMEDINHSMVNSGIDKDESAILLSDDGCVIASQHNYLKDGVLSSIFAVNFEDPVKNVATTILTEKKGMTNTIFKGESYYVAFSEVDLTGWILCISSPVSSIVKPVNLIADNIENCTDRVVDSVSDGIFYVVKVCLVLSAVTLLVIILLMGKLTKKMAEPLKKLTEDVNEISKGNFGVRTQVSSNDEVGVLAEAFDSMAQSLEKYIEDLRDITIKEERIASELNVAHRIQESSLPVDFPDLQQYGLCATMNPAKEVGGDFYDFFAIDDTHIGLVMADVSGKGVPAALFMMTSKTLIKNCCMTGLDPATVLATVNNQLCEGNEAEMFVTVWLGNLDLETGIVTAANAGHEYPAICRANGEFELLKDKHGFVLAGMPNSKYKNYEIALEKGDKIFVYTDGVPEATNVDNVLFGTDRMLEALNKNKDQKNDAILEGVRDAIGEFVGEAPPFDDLTMLCFEYRGV